MNEHAMRKSDAPRRDPVACVVTEIAAVARAAPRRRVEAARGSS
jgi:hypothetical protein